MPEMRRADGAPHRPPGRQTRQPVLGLHRLPRLQGHRASLRKTGRIHQRSAHPKDPPRSHRSSTNPPPRSLVLTFKKRTDPTASPAQLYLQFSNDLGLPDPWSGNTVRVPDSSGPADRVFFEVVPSGELEINLITLTIANEPPRDNQRFALLIAQEDTP